MQQRYFADLKPFIDADPAFDITDYYPGTLTPEPQLGGIYTLPRTTLVPVLAYNKQLFAAKGRPEPRADWTWPEMRDAALALAQLNKTEVQVYGMIDNGFGQLALAGELGQTAPKLLTMPETEINLDVPEVRRALRSIGIMASSGALYITPENILFNDQLRSLIRQQRVAMWPAGLMEPDQPSFPIGVVPFPVLPMPFPTSVDNLAMSKGTQHPEAAWRWLSFLSRQFPQQPYQGGEFSYPVPARKSLAQQYLQQLNPDTRAAVETTLGRTPVPLPWDVLGPLRRPLIDMADGSISPEAAATIGQQTLEEWRVARQATPEPEPTAAPVFVATPVPAAAIPAGATVITFHPGDLGEQAVPLVAQFNARATGVFVQLQTDETSDLAQRAATTDCFAGYGGPTEADRTALLDLQPLIDADATFPRDDYAPAVLAPYQHGDGLFGLPYRIDLPALFYNPARFTAAGVAPPTANWTFADLQAAAQQLSSGAGRQRQYGFASLSMPADLDLILASQGAALTVTEGGSERLTLTSPPLVAVLRDYLRLLRETSPSSTLVGYRAGERDDANARTLVQTGTVAMWLASGSISFGAPLPVDGGMALAPVPRSADALPGPVATPTIGLYISARSPHAQACWQWLTALSGEISGVQGGFPARTALATSAAFSKQALPGAAEVYAAAQPLLAQVPPSPSPLQTQLDRYWFYGAVNESFVTGEARDALERAQETTTQYLACVQGGGQPGPCARQVDPEYQGFSQ